MNKDPEEMTELELLRSLPGLMADELIDHARVVAEKDAEIERLRAALRDISQHAADVPGKADYPDDPGFKPRWFQLGWVQGRKSLAQMARKALAEKG